VIFGTESFTENSWALIVSAACWSLAAGYVLVGAYRGSPHHMRPRIGLGVGCVFLAVVYVLDLFDVISEEHARDWIRGTAWVVAIAVALTARTGMLYGRRAAAAAAALAARGVVDRD